MVDTTPWLVVGLGNPGAGHARHRHNVGFMVVEAWLEQFSSAAWRDKWNGRFVAVTGPFGRATVLEPQTYMNRSGDSVSAAAAFHRTPTERVVVVHDEVDFAFGRLAIKSGGGHGGHNGVRDIVTKLGSSDFVRVRVGVGRPDRGEVSDWVLSAFSPNEAADLGDILETARRALDCILTQGVQPAMNEFNRLPT